MIRYKVYRETGDLEARIKTALAKFARQYSAMPASIAVHPIEAPVVRTLGWEVRAVGGCNVPEVWLEFPPNGEGEFEQRRLLWEVDDDRDD